MPINRDDKTVRKDRRCDKDGDDAGRGAPGLDVFVVHFFFSARLAPRNATASIALRSPRADRDDSLTVCITPRHDSQILRQRKLQLDQRALIMDGPLATFGDHAVPVWVDRILVPEQRTLTVRVERKR